MEVSKFLKKQIIIEVLILIFFIFVIVYSIISINSKHDTDIYDQDGMVVIMDDSSFSGLEVLSDGEGLNTEGVTYTITNNNSDAKKYKVVIVPNVHDEEVLKQIRVVADDEVVYNLVDLERENGGYVVISHTLSSGYTKIHSIKLWYKLDTTDERNVEFQYRLVTDE